MRGGPETTDPAVPDGAATPRGMPPIPPTGSWGPAVRLVVAAVVAVVALYLVVALRGLLLEALIAIILATGLTPPVDGLQRRGVPRTLAVALINVAFLLALAGLLFLVVPPVIDGLQSLGASAPQLAEALLARYDGLRRLFPFLPAIDRNLASYLASLGDQLAGLLGQAVRILRFAAGFVGGVFSAFFVLLITFYLVVDGRRVRGYLLSFFPPERRGAVERVVRRMGERMGGWFLGQLALMSVIGLASFIALTILGVRGAILLAVIAAIGEAIPILGPILSAVPAVIVAFIQDPPLALWVILAYVIIQQIESNILAPWILARSVNLHPLAVLFALTIGGTLLGVLGAIIAPPVAAAVAVLLDEVRPRAAARATGDHDGPSGASEGAEESPP